LGFFRQNRLNTDILTLNPNKLEYSKLGIYDWLLKQRIFQRHHYYNKPICTYFFVAFKNPDKEPAKTLNRAVDQVLRALGFYMQQRDTAVDLQFFYPIIVFDGKMFEVSYDPDINIVESKHISLFFERELEQPEKIIDHGTGEVARWITSKPFIIDIVRLDHFDRFLYESF
jgi:hypothetical protein